jgi:hypothetical protein
LLLLVPIFLSSSVLNGQEQPGSQRQRNQVGAPELLRTAQAFRVEDGPKLDGTLDDPSWRKATPISNFLQREPFEGQTPTEKTEVRILYTKHEVYFGITCFDSQPKKIISRELRRDVSQEFLTLSTLLQMNTSNNQGASANIKLRCYRPDSDLFVIYTGPSPVATVDRIHPLALSFQGARCWTPQGINSRTTLLCALRLSAVTACA